MGKENINIRPGVGILSVLRHLNYKPWFALAEFVDNSLQSYLRNRDRIYEIHGVGHQLKISIELDVMDEGRIIIRDNAGGISQNEYSRAFRPAEIPPDRSGLNEFGMGMKSASCWFAPNWRVRTSALDEPVERVVSFNVEEIVLDRREELSIELKEAKLTDHYTEIILNSPFNMPTGRTIGKIKDHLSDIYRVFTRNKEMLLSFNGEILNYQAPQILCAPHYKTPHEDPIKWEKEISLDLGNGKMIKGFGALRETGSTQKAGFALFRRNRLIQGSGEDGYRPHHIFGNPNSYRYQRLFGELFLEGFGVSHTKDGFQWEGLEDYFLERLKEKLDEEPLPLLRQAEKRRPGRKELKSGADKAATKTAKTVKKEVPPAAEAMDDDPEPNEENSPPEELGESNSVSEQKIHFTFRGIIWEITIELVDDPVIEDWLEISNRDDNTGIIEKREIRIRLSLVHPFMVKFAGTHQEQIEPLLRVGVGIALGEILAYDAGVKYASTIRSNLNELLKEALSKD